MTEATATETIKESRRGVQVNAFGASPGARKANLALIAKALKQSRRGAARIRLDLKIHMPELRGKAPYQMLREESGTVVVASVEDAEWVLGQFQEWLRGLGQ